MEKKVYIKPSLKRMYADCSQMIAASNGNVLIDVNSETGIGYAGGNSGDADASPLIVWE